MQPWDMGERPTPPDEQLPPWYERLAPYAAGAAVLIAIYLVLVLIEQSGVGLAFVLFLGATAGPRHWRSLAAHHPPGLARCAARPAGPRGHDADGLCPRGACPARARCAWQVCATRTPAATGNPRTLARGAGGRARADAAGRAPRGRPDARHHELGPAARRQWPLLALVAGIMLAIGTGRIWLAIVLFVVLVLALWRPLSRLRRGKS